MKRTLLGFLAAGLLTAIGTTVVAEDFCPPWFRGIPLSVQAEWDFTVPPDWTDYYPEWVNFVGDGEHEHSDMPTHGHGEGIFWDEETGIYTEGDWGYFYPAVDNWYDDEPNKYVWVQITWEGSNGSPYVFDVFGAPWDDPIQGYYVDSFDWDANHHVDHWEMHPNPWAEFVYIAIPPWTYVDEIMIDTISTSKTGPMVLTVDDLYAGENGTFTVTNGDANAKTYLAYSLQGMGSTYVTQLNVWLDLSQPVQADGSRTTDGSGMAQWVLLIPDAAEGRRVWFQAAQYQNKSNVVEKRIQ